MSLLVINRNLSFKTFLFQFVQLYVLLQWKTSFICSVILHPHKHFPTKISNFQLQFTNVQQRIFLKRIPDNLCTIYHN